MLRVRCGRPGECREGNRARGPRSRQCGRRRGRTASVDSLGPLRSPQENKAETLSVPVVRKSRNTDWYNFNHKPS